MFLGHILQAHEGCDFDFLRGRNGEEADPMRRFHNPGV